MNRLNRKKARNKLGVTEPVLSALTQSGLLGYTSTTGLFSDQAILSYQQFGTQWEVDERFGPTWRMIEETTYDGLPPIESIGPQPPATRIHMYVCSAGQRDPRHPAETMNTDTGWIAHFYLASNYFYFPNPTELSLVGLPPLKLSEPRPVLGANLPVTLYPHPSGCLGLVVVEGLNRPLKGATHEAYDVAVPLLDELSARYDVPLPVAHTMVVGVPTGVIHLEFGHRPKAKQIDSESKILSRCPHPELRDAYALYREAVSSNNPFHSFLAFWKVYKEAVYVRKAWGAQHQRSDTRVGEEGFPDLSRPVRLRSPA